MQVTYFRYLFSSKEDFRKCDAQKLWIENYDKIVELYNVERTSGEASCLITRPKGEEDVVSLSVVNLNLTVREIQIWNPYHVFCFLLFAAVHQGRDSAQSCDASVPVWQKHEPQTPTGRLYSLGFLFVRRISNLLTF